MSSNLESRISLEVFQRHFVLTHMKDEAAGLFDELKKRADGHGESFDNLLAEWIKRNYKQGGFQDDNWNVREVPLDWCYFAHTDFRGFPVPKDQRFLDFLSNQREIVESDSFPCSSRICAPWSGPMPEPLAQERGHEKYYILDGQQRVIRHWYHYVPNVRVFIYRGQLEV
jgi:hypothetical protein